MECVEPTKVKRRWGMKFSRNNESLVIKLSSSNVTKINNFHVTQIMNIMRST